MTDRKKVMQALQNCPDCSQCYTGGPGFGVACRDQLRRDAIVLLKEQDEEHNRLLSWLGKFCRHIDNSDKWLTDEENLAFFKEKMKQQFGWDTD